MGTLLPVPTAVLFFRAAFVARENAFGSIRHIELQCVCPFLLRWKAHVCGRSCSSSDIQIVDENRTVQRTFRRPFIGNVADC